MVAGDHHDSDACGVAFLNRVGNICSNGVLQGDQPKEFEDEIVLTLGQFFGVNKCSCYAQNAQTQARHGGHFAGNLVHLGPIQMA